MFDLNYQFRRFAFAYILCTSAPSWIKLCTGFVTAVVFVGLPFSAPIVSILISDATFVSYVIARSP